MTETVLAEATCGLPRLLWQPSPNFNQGRTKLVSLIVVHDIEGSYASGINWFLNSHSEVSAHLTVREDGLEATQLVAFEDKAWHVANFNPESIGVEMGGFEARGFGPAEWAAEARIVAYLCHRFNIPAVWSKNGLTPGFCRHFDLGEAGGGHDDPTTDDGVWARFVTQVQQVAQGAEWPSTPWGK